MDKDTKFKLLLYTLELFCLRKCQLLSIELVLNILLSYELELIKRIVLVLTRKGLFYNALQFLKNIKSPSDSCEIAVALINEGYLDEAMMIFEETLKDVNNLEGLLKRETLEKIAMSLAKVGYFEKALDVANKLEEEYPQSVPNILREAAISLAVRNQLNDALKVIGEINNPRIRSAALTELAMYLAKNSQREKSLEFFDKALSAAREIKLGSYDRSWALSDIANFSGQSRLF